MSSSYIVTKCILFFFWPVFEFSLAPAISIPFNNDDISPFLSIICKQFLVLSNLSAYTENYCNLNVFPGIINPICQNHLSWSISLKLSGMLSGAKSNFPFYKRQMKKNSQRSYATALRECNSNHAVISTTWWYREERRNIMQLFCAAQHACYNDNPDLLIACA